jgi:hypothetical protein
MDKALLSDLIDFFSDTASDFDDAREEGFDEFSSMVGSKWCKRVSDLADRLQAVPQT